jgi:hypothetical protein
MLGHWIGSALARGRGASASACAPMIRCAQRRRRGRDLQPVFFDPEGTATPWLASPQSGTRRAARLRAAAGRHGASAPAPGLPIEQRTDLSFASVDR